MAVEKGRVWSFGNGKAASAVDDGGQSRAARLEPSPSNAAAWRPSGEFAATVEQGKCYTDAANLVMNVEGV